MLSKIQTTELQNQPVQTPAVNHALDIGEQPAAIIFITIGAVVGLVAAFAAYNRVHTDSIANLLKIVLDSKSEDKPAGKTTAKVNSKLK